MRDNPFAFGISLQLVERDKKPCIADNPCWLWRKLQ